jgi:hypothetical protein
MKIRLAFRHHAGLKRARLKPNRVIATRSPSPVAQTWNRIGGLLSRLEGVSGIPSAASLAVWMVECGGLPFSRGRPVLRFEAHVFFERWGKHNNVLFDQHFQFGGRNGIEGARWLRHRFRPTGEDEWRSYHGDQVAEYEAFSLAERLADRETACLSASFGGPQIMGFNHAVAGYDSAAEMAKAFARSERWQVFGFLDFCAAKGIVDALNDEDWFAFATVYNGPGNAEAYAAKIAEAHHMSQQLMASEI